jgi:hypothetical protein
MAAREVKWLIDTRMRGTGLLRVNGCHRKCAHTSFVTGGLGRRKNSMRWKEQKIQRGTKGKIMAMMKERKEEGEM